MSRQLKQSIEYFNSSHQSVETKPDFSGLDAPSILADCRI